MAFTNFQHQCTANFKIHDYSRATPALKEALKDLPRLAALASHETGLPIVGTININIARPQDMKDATKISRDKILPNLSSSDFKFHKKSNSLKNILFGKNCVTLGLTHNSNQMTINAHNLDIKDVEKEFKKTIFHEFVHIVQHQNTNLPHHNIQIFNASIRSTAKYGCNHPNSQSLLNAYNNLKTLMEGHAYYYQNKVEKEGKIYSTNTNSSTSIPKPIELGLFDQNRQNNSLHRSRQYDFYSIGEKEIIKMLNENKHRDPKALLFQALNYDYSSLVQEEINKVPIEPHAKNRIMHTQYYLKIINTFICDNLKDSIYSFKNLI